MNWGVEIGSTDSAGVVRHQETSDDRHNEDRIQFQMNAVFGSTVEGCKFQDGFVIALVDFDKLTAETQLHRAFEWEDGVIEQIGEQDQNRADRAF